MSIAIMQPYFFPYFGYFQLLHAVDTFVVADDLNYIKNGFINKNKILINNEAKNFSLQLNKASQNRHINEISLRNNCKELLNKIFHSYKKAPYFEATYALLSSMICDDESNLATFNTKTIKSVADYLGITTEVLYSSHINKDETLTFDDRIIDISTRLQKSCYINPIGGTSLYQHDRFKQHNLSLRFIKPKTLHYQQFSQQFIENLSIIDALMFNSIESLKEQLNDYTLIA